MVITTRIKLLLKKLFPPTVFKIIRFLAEITLLRLIPLYFKWKISSFKKPIIKELRYGGIFFKLWIDPRNGYLDAQIFANNKYETHITNEIISNVKEGDVCIDVGANIGHHTIIMSKVVGSDGHVFAYEPIDKIRDQLNKSLIENKINNVTILKEALSNEETYMDLFLRDGNIGGSSFVDVGDKNKIKVNVKTLDSYNYEKVNFIKIDVEGFELNVLKGGENTLEKTKPKIIFEYSPIYYKRHNPSDTTEILNFLKNKNYILYDLEDKRKVINNINSFVEEFSDGLRSQTNILALPK